MRALDLFSGIGGFALACEWAGIETVAFCEINHYCQRVLRKHWPSVPIYYDVRELHPEHFAGPVDLVCGGFPCQPYSVAGKRKGAADDRDLWPEMLRCVREFRPAWVCGENVAGFISMGLDSCLADLEELGYSCRPLVIPACAVGAPHRRDRVWLVAHATGQGLEGIYAGREHRVGMQLLETTIWQKWEAEPGVDRVAHGVPYRVDRLRALGNAVVPQQVYPILRAIMEAHKDVTAE